MRARIPLALVMLLLALAPSAAAAQPCGDVVCSSAGGTSSGIGNCDQGAPLYTEAHDVTVMSGVVGRDTYVSEYSDCYHYDDGTSSHGYRERGLGAHSNSIEISIVWWRSDDQGATNCHTRIDVVTVLDIGCPAGAPPMVQGVA